MYSNRVQNLSASSWVQGGNNKRRFENQSFVSKNVLNPNLYPDKDIEQIHLGKQPQQQFGFQGGVPDAQAGVPGGPISQFGDDEKDPLCIKIRQIIQEELTRPPDNAFSQLNLGVTGLNYVFDTEQVTGCKIFWAVIIVSCFSICSYQMVNRINLFLGYPVAAEIGVVQNQTVIFPVLTICPKETTALLAMKIAYNEEMRGINITDTCKESNQVKLTDLIGFRNQTAEQIWALTSPVAQGMFIDMTPSFKDLLEGRNFVNISVTEKRLPLGTCAVYQLNTTVEFHGIATQIFFKNDNPVHYCERYGYSIMTREPHEPLDMKAVSPVTTGAKVGFTVLVKQYEAMDTPIDACVSSERALACWDDCADQLLSEKVKCRLPYMRLHNLPECKDAKESNATHEIAVEILLDLNMTKDCGCIRRCIRVMYSMLPKSYKFGQTQTEVSIYFASNYFEIVKESYAYDWMSLLCDIGGNLGLYLGLSVLSVFEIVQSLVEYYGDNPEAKKTTKQFAQQKARFQPPRFHAQGMAY